MKILTIGIPTYKRPKQIQRTVRALLPQLTDEVTLVVKDNCSPEPVETLFTEDEKKHFVIIRNKVNIGGDANIAGVLYDCETKWCWTLGDDDVIADNAVEIVLTHIRAYPEVSFFKFDSPYAKKTHGMKEAAFLCKLRKVYTVYSKLLFMSTSIYNMEKMKDSLFYYYKYLSTMNGQNIFLFKYLESHDNAICLFTDEHIVGQDEDEIVNPWSYEDYVAPCPLVFQAFKEKRKVLNGSLFVGLTFGYFRNILLQHFSFTKRWKLFWYVAINYGLLNTFHYHSGLIVKCLIMAIIPKKMMNYLKTRIQNK